MTKANDAEITSESSEKEALGKISPATIDAALSDIESDTIDTDVTNEKSVIEATRLFLRSYGVRKSGAAIRDAVDIPHTSVGPKEAVNTLSNMGFKASFGRIKLEGLAEDFFPLIAFKKNGEAYIINSQLTDGKIILTEPLNKEKKQHKNKPWNKLGKSKKTKLIKQFIEDYTKEKNLSKKQSALLKTFLHIL